MKSIKMAVLYVIFSMILPLSCSDDSSKSSSRWQVIGRGISDGEISSLALDTDSSGNPIVAYRDDANGSGLTVQKYNGTDWEIVGSAGFSAGEVFGVCVDEYNGTIYTAFSDAAEGEKLSVMKSAGGAWSYVGSHGFTIDTAEDLNEYWNRRIAFLVINESSMYAAFKSNSGALYVYEYDGTWSDISSGDLPSSGVEGNISIHGLSSSAVYVSYSLTAGRAGYIKKYNGSSWENAGASSGLFTTQGGRDFSLKIFNGTPYIAYSEIAGVYDTGGDNNSEPDRALVKRLNGTSWEIMGDFISASTATEISLSFDSDGNPYICYMDWDGIASPTIHKYSNSSWTVLGKSIIDVGTHYVTMTVFNAKPIVAFNENEGEYQWKLTVMRYK